MATQLKEGQQIKREIRVHGVEAPVIVTISQEGITFALKGSRTPLSQNWVQIVQATNTPGNVPSFLAGKPYELLQHQANKKK
jgi:hypothetical protein